MATTGRFCHSDEKLCFVNVYRYHEHDGIKTGKVHFYVLGLNYDMFFLPCLLLLCSPDAEPVTQIHVGSLQGAHVASGIQSSSTPASS